MATKSLTDEIAEYLDEKARKKSQATHDQYASVLENIYLPWAKSAGITQASQCTDKCMERFEDYLRAKRNTKGEPLSKTTLRTYIRAVRVFLNWAEVPRGKYQQPDKPGKRLLDTLNAFEVDAMEAAAFDERDKIIVRVLFDTGVRVSELLGLRPEDLREEGRRPIIRVIGKGDDQRDVFIPANTFRRLRNLADHCPSSPGYIFVSRRRYGDRVQRLTKSGVEQLFRHLGERAGIKKRIFPHLARHSFVTRMARAGLDREALRKQLGHRTMQMIDMVYNQITPADQYDDMMKALRT